MKKKILYRDHGKTKYLIRWTLFTCKWFSIKIHKALQSDRGPLHDHPWNYISIILWGGYYELTETRGEPRLFYSYKSKLTGITFINPPFNPKDEFEEIIQKEIPIYSDKKWYDLGSILVRKAASPHKLEIPEGKFCLSLIFTSYKKRDWGFTTKQGWHSHKIESY